jgi:hypothetical protein
MKGRRAAVGGPSPDTPPPTSISPQSVLSPKTKDPPASSEAETSPRELTVLRGYHARPRIASSPPGGTSSVPVT